ncbi:Eco57I restriction-modification methylase domain-containing protein [Empedobacter brevis]
MKNNEIKDYSPPEISQFFADVYSKQKTQKEKREIGQFFTPNNISDFMGSLATTQKEHVTILDPGCGTLNLSCSLINHLVKNNLTKSIQLDIYETDTNLTHYIENIIKTLSKFLSSKNIRLICNVYLEDFVIKNAKYLYHNTELKYDIIISNPPYFKLAKTDERALVTEIINGGQPNIYSLFMAISSRLLNEDGEMIFITPRSFTSGLYFKKFREYFLDNVNLHSLHLFVNRNDTFKKDKVLQELLITKAVKSNIDKVKITSSDSDLNIHSDKTYKYNEIYNDKSENKFVFIPISENEDRILKIINKWNKRLEDFGITISTGPVVDFRTKENILFNRNEVGNSKPYYRLNNVTQMDLNWPLQDFNKEQYIIQNDATKSILRPNSNYIFLRRQSAKGDKHRLICTPYFKEKNIDYIGIDNKLNYIYSKERELSKEEVFGISALLNSTFMNQYFQTFNGNVNVSSTEIKQLKFPDYDFIIQIGKKVINNQELSFEEINQYILQKLKYEQN